MSPAAIISTGVDAAKTVVQGKPTATVTEITEVTNNVDVKCSVTVTEILEKPKSRDFLHIIDERTGQYYQIPIRHNAISASDFKKIKAPEGQFYADQNEGGIRVLDPGFTNTAVVESKVTYVLVNLAKHNLSLLPCSVLTCWW